MFTLQMRTGNNFGNKDQLYAPSQILDKHRVAGSKRYAHVTLQYGFLRKWGGWS